MRAINWIALAINAILCGSLLIYNLQDDWLTGLLAWFGESLLVVAVVGCVLHWILRASGKPAQES